MPPPNIQGKHGAILLNPGGGGSLSYFAITVVHPPPAGNTTIDVVGSAASWTAREIARFPMPPASPNRYVLIIEATQAALKRAKALAAGDTDDITVTVSNSTTPTDKDDASMDGVFGP
jgi:hypothetical protein